MIMRKISYILILSAGMLLPTSCIKDEPAIDDLEYTRPLNISAPVSVINSNYKNILKRLADNDNGNVPDIKVADDGMLYVMYSKDYEVRWNDVLNLNPVSWNTQKHMSLVKGNKISWSQDKRILLNSDRTQRIDSSTIDKTTMTVKAEPLAADGEGTLTIPDFSINGKTLEVKWPLNEGLNKSIDLKGYKMIPSHAADSSFITPAIVISGTASVNSAEALFEFSMSMTDILPQVIFGFFGTKEVYNEQSNMGLEFFDTYDFSEDIEFTGANIGLTVSNWTGTPFNVTMDIMRFIKRDKDSVKINFFNLDNTLFVDQVSHNDYRPDGKFEPHRNNYALDESNSDVNALLSFDPISYRYKMIVESNPKGEIKENFLTQESTLEYHANVYVPIWMKVTNIDRNDTIDFDLNGIILDEDNADYVDTLAMYFDFENGFPLTLTAQAYLLDKHNRVVDSLFPKREMVWTMPDIDRNDRVSSWKKSTHKAVMTNKKIKKCSDADVKKILLKTVANTGTGNDNRFFKFYKDYGMNMKFSFEVVSNLSKK